MTKVKIDASRAYADDLERAFIDHSKPLSAEERGLLQIVSAIREQIPEPEPKSTWRFHEYKSGGFGHIANLYLGDEFKGVLYGSEAVLGAQALVDSLNAQAQS